MIVLLGKKGGVYVVKATVLSSFAHARPCELEGGMYMRKNVFSMKV